MISQIKFNLNNLSLLITVVVMSLLMSCGDRISNLPATTEGFQAIENELKNKFGANTYYTDLAITYNKSIGNIVSVTVTESPESLHMGQWNLTQNTWKQNQDITIDVPNGTKASDFMFQLNEHLNLKKLGELSEKSSTQLTIEKSIENPTLSMAFVKFPKNGDISKTEYCVMLEPENGGNTFTFCYKLNGDLIKMDY